MPRITEEVEKPVREAYSNSLSYQKDLDEYNDYLFFMQFDVRNVFIPDNEDEVILVHDYTNLEAMLQAEYSGDELLIEMFKQGYDIHGYTAVQVAGLDCEPNECKKLYPKMRQTYKSVRFLLQYGGSEFALSRSTGMSKEESREKLDDYYKTFKGEAEYKIKQIKFAHKYGIVYSLLGRKRHLEGINSDNRKISSYFERLALNYPNQAGAADVIMEAQITIEANERLRELGYKQLLQVHDEVIGSVPRKNVEEAMKIKKRLMENCVKLKKVALIADGDWSANSYAEAK